MGAAFQAAKDALSAASRLAYPDPVAEVNLMTDASSSVVGAVLQQKVAAGGVAAASILQQEAGQCTAQLLCI
jgi:hypothetical protein